MTAPTKPIELRRALTALDDAWAAHDHELEHGSPLLASELYRVTIPALIERVHTLGDQWQALGGTSDIDCITFPPAHLDPNDPLAVKYLGTPEERAEVDALIQSLETDEQRDIAQWQTETITTREGDRPL